MTRARLNPFIEAYANDAYTLDIGCADSPYARTFSNRVGFDALPGVGVDVVGDAHTLPFPDQSFEQILCTEVLEHLHTPQIAIGEMFRVLKSGGTLILTTRFIFPIHDAPGDYYRFTKYGLKHLFRGWDIISLNEESSTMGTLGVLLQRIAYHSELRGGRFTKAIMHVLAHVSNHLGWLVIKEYGMRSKVGVREEKDTMTSGYFLVARKRA